MISGELAGFLQQGIGIYVGTRNAELEPNGARAIAARVEEDGARLIIYLADVAAARLLPDLHANGQADFARATTCGGKPASFAT